MRRFVMPSYDFSCEKCKKRFTLHLTISEHEKIKFRCPKCKSIRVKQQIGPFQAVTSKKS
ncbi:FmdB family zinc ribbon protein [Thermodesulfobacteriota bacterium]